MDAKPDAESSPTRAVIKSLRARGLSQSEISRRTKIPQPRLSRWENGEVAAGADDALRLQALESQLAAAEAGAPLRRSTDRAPGNG